MNAGQESKGLRILLCCTGSVACMSIPSLLPLLKGRFQDSEIRIVLTENAKHFFKDQDLTQHAVVQEDNAWDIWSKVGDPILHIDLAKWTDVMLIAPLDCHTLAKLANGLCDNLVTNVARASDFSSGKKIIFCPAMNTKMWEHPITSQQIGTLKSWGFVEIPPFSKKLACGDVGIGAMAEVETIVEGVSEVLGHGKK